MANTKILGQLAALGACYDARQWFFEEGFASAQEAWDSPNIRPKDMLWILRRTMGKSYRKRRALTKLAVELLDLVHGDKWYAGNTSDETLRQALISYGEGKLQLSALRRTAQKAIDAGRGWTVGERLYANLQGSGCMALEYQGILPLRFGEEMAAQQALIRKHFPKPPRLQ